MIALIKISVRLYETVHLLRKVENFKSKCGQYITFKNKMSCPSVGDSLVTLHEGSNKIRIKLHGYYSIIQELTDYHEKARSTFFIQQVFTNQIPTLRKVLF